MLAIAVVMTAVYAGGLALLRVAELDDIVQPIARRLRRR